MSESYSLISAREHFLSLPEVSAFADYLSDYIAGRAFNPPYLTQTYRPRVQYCFVSFEDAWDQYIQETTNRRFEDDLLAYESALREAVEKKNDDAFIEITKKIFAARPLVLRSNIKKIEAVKNMTDKIDCACRELESDSPNYSIFGRAYGPAMSSFYSRLYATLIPDFITYESRVSAALCYLIREYCLFCGMDLPKTLNWGSLHGWGKDYGDHSRNASWENNVFEPLDRIKKRPMRERTFARGNSLASWVVVEAIKRAKSKKGCEWLDGIYPIRKVEASLYMMGAELPPVNQALL